MNRNLDPLDTPFPKPMHDSDNHTVEQEETHQKRVYAI